MFKMLVFLVSCGCLVLQITPNLLVSVQAAPADGSLEDCKPHLDLCPKPGSCEDFPKFHTCILSKIQENPDVCGTEYEDVEFWIDIYPALRRYVGCD